MSEDDPTHPTIYDGYLISLHDGKHYKVLTYHLSRLGYTAQAIERSSAFLPLMQ